MAEPQTMSKADVLALIDTLRRPRDAGDMSLADGLDAIAAAVSGWCVIEHGHVYPYHRVRWDDDWRQATGCMHCGQRRVDGTEGGR